MQNSQYKIGIIKELDAAKAKAKVEFADEDGVSSYWLNINTSGSSSNKFYAMPDIGSQVNCLLDFRGENGTILGSFFSDSDGAPSGNADEINIQTASGAAYIINKSTGDLNIRGAKNITIVAENITLKASSVITLKAGQIKMEQ